MRLVLIFFTLIHTNCFAQFYSQIGQDRYVYEHFFYKKSGGTFFDIGAHDGMSLSNTYFFEKEQGWNGICVEPNNDVFEELQKNRNCIFVNGCIANWTGPGLFLKITGPSEMFSGLVNKYDPRHLERIHDAIQKNGSFLEEIEVQCFTFNDIMDQNGLTHIDFMSIDTEGGEFDIIASIDFDRFQIDVITLENAYNDKRFTTYLALKGYRVAIQLRWDTVYVHKRFKPSKKN